MAKITMYDATDFDKNAFEALTAMHEVTFIPEPLKEDSDVQDCEVLSLFVSSSLEPAMLDKMPSLKLIACRSTGFNNIPMQEAQARGITVVNVPTYGEHTVAEYVFALLLSLSRKLPAALEQAKDGEPGHAGVQGFDLFGKTLGIVGSGKIGCQVAKIANGFGMQVLAYDLYPNIEREHEFHFRYVSLEELLASSDVVTLHAPYTQENRHLINTSQLERMKPGALLINTARGELVDTKAVIEALEKGTLAGAALDVLEGEALLTTPEEVALLRDETLDASQLRFSLEISILKKLPNVLITNHNAFNTVEAIARINATTLDNIYAFLQGAVKNEVKL